MRSALDTFRQEASQLNEFLDAAIAEEKLHPFLSKLPTEPDGEIDPTAIATFLRASTNKRKYTYVVGVITIYGALESFVRNVTKEYLAAISRISGNYGGLPEKIAANHTNLSINYLLNVRDGKIGNDDTIEQVVDRLGKCLRKSDDYELNANAFTAKGQNVNRKRIREIAQSLGVELVARRILRTAAARDYFSAHDPSVLEEVSDEVAQTQFAVVDEVTDARNLIAHGVADLNQIDNPSILRDYLREVTTYCSAISEVFEQEAVLHALKLEKCTNLAEPIKTFGRNVVCFPFDGGDICVGDTLVLRMNDSIEPVRWSPIASIQIDGVEHQEVVGAAGCKIGVKVAFRVAACPGYCLLSKKAQEIIFS